MERYSVTGMDSAADGMERLRNWNEFILLAYPSGESSVADLCAEWKADLDSCMREDEFDFDAARAAIDTYCTEAESSLSAELQNNALYETCNPSGLPADEWDGYDSATFRLYVTDNSAAR